MPKDHLNVNKNYRKEFKEYKGKKGWKYIINIYIIMNHNKGMTSKLI